MVFLPKIATISDYVEHTLYPRICQRRGDRAVPGLSGIWRKGSVDAKKRFFPTSRTGTMGVSRIFES